MEIGTVIRTYRLNKNLAQEEVARRLGVTPSDVNKWEKGHSMPDIALLSPIAKLLGISLDTLLSNVDTLSEEEANNILHQAQEKLGKEPFEAGYFLLCPVALWRESVVQSA